MSSDLLSAVFLAFPRLTAPRFSYNGFISNPGSRFPSQGFYRSCRPCLGCSCHIFPRLASAINPASAGTAPAFPSFVCFFVLKAAARPRSTPSPVAGRAPPQAQWLWRIARLRSTQSSPLQTAGSAPRCRVRRYKPDCSRRWRNERKVLPGSFFCHRVPPTDRAGCSQGRVPSPFAIALLAISFKLTAEKFFLK